MPALTWMRVNRNTCNVFAKTSPYVLQPEKFALDLGLHFVSTYVSP